jgi:hypothetical protein
VCVPGSEVACYTSYCTYWGTMACASDGLSWGGCKEAKVPTECQAVANASMDSVALERCCIAQGFCCLDSYDLNGNGDTKDLIGNCDSVTCGP